jgi:hypothetical protein
MDVETRPHRVYPVRWPGASRESRVRPEYHGVGALRAAPAPTRGLGLLFPPHTVHARDSTSAVVGAPCELTGTDHVHVRQAVVAPDDVLRSAGLAELLARATPGDVSEALHELAGRRGPLRVERACAVHEAETVQLGDDALTRLDPRYVVERTVIPAGALVAGSAGLARRYVELVTGPRDDPHAVAAFLGDLVGAAADAAGDNLLGYHDGLPAQPATVLGLFGLVRLDRATSIMISAGRQQRGGP